MADGIDICNKKVSILKITKQRQVSQNTNNQGAPAVRKPAFLPLFRYQSPHYVVKYHASGDERGVYGIPPTVEDQRSEEKPDLCPDSESSSAQKEIDNKADREKQKDVTV